MKVCARPVGPRVVDAKAYGGLGPTNRAAGYRERGTAAERGYDTNHRHIRAWWQSKIDSGTIVTCWRCHKRILGRRWHLGHDDHDREVTRGPECESCNLRAAGKAAHGVEST